MDTAVNIVIFILGSIFSLALIPLAEKRRADFRASRRLEEIYIELSDVQEEITRHIEAFFSFLHEIRARSNGELSAELPIPIPQNIDTTLLFDSYKESAIKLTPQQRQVIKRIPNNIDSIMSEARNAVEAAKKYEYCVQSIKNTVKLSCHLVHLINGICNQQGRFQVRSDINSNSAVMAVLKSIGFSNEQIALSRIEESNFN
ncbi:hypothetical protein [Pseudomonas sp. B392_1p]|uniref:hypothetical protein n=1 Tax=Pseudomonas sp. B392_1p TaxID=3457507 RepID=UPI003FD17754